MLIKQGADVNARDRTGDTPIHDAVRLGKFRLIKTLLNHGANLRAKNQIGKSPIDMVHVWYAETKSDYADAIMEQINNAMVMQEHAEKKAQQPGYGKGGAKGLIGSKAY